MIAQDSGGEKGTTNQRMELTAALNACREVEKMDAFARVRVYSDSAYLVNCWKQNWWRAWQVNGWKNSKKEPVANPDLWMGLIPFFEKVPNGYDFIKVKGHAGNEWNEPTAMELPSEPPIPATISFVKGPDGEEVEFFEVRG